MNETKLYFYDEDGNVLDDDKLMVYFNCEQDLSELYGKGDDLIDTYCEWGETTRFSRTEEPWELFLDLQIMKMILIIVLEKRPTQIKLEQLLIS